MSLCIYLTYSANLSLTDIAPEEARTRAGRTSSLTTGPRRTTEAPEH